MKRSFTLMLLFVSLAYSSFSQSIIQDNIYFNSDEYTINAESESNINAIAEKLTLLNEYNLQIIGHTDQIGSSAYNIELSKKRAESVKQHLIDLGLMASNIEIAYRGESDLKFNGLDDNSKQQNRRVEFVATGYVYDSVEEMVQQLESNDGDKHIVDPVIDSKLTLTKGTEVSIPANAFCHLDGTPLMGGKVDLTFKEAFEYSDMVDERLYTQTEDQLLETGGMIYIEASQNGQPLRMQDGKSIELLFPVQEMKDGMELFTASEDENGIIWEETGEQITNVKEKPNTPPIKVDLSPLLDFAFADADILDLNYPEMIPYPRPARIAYPPFKDNYTEEGYEEALQKYHAVMEAYEKDKVDRPERLKQWEEEVERRKQDIYKHKKYFAGLKIREEVKLNLVRLKSKKDEICHARLTDVLFQFLDNDIGRVGYDEWYYLRKAFGKGLGDVIEHGGLSMPQFTLTDGSRFCPDFMAALKEVQNSIEDVKFEMGVADTKSVNRYLMRTSSLGWINCDRFYEMVEEDKMDLQFASVSDDDRYYLVFKDMKSLIRPRKVDGNIVFKGIPKGENVRLVGINVQDGNAFLASQDFTLNSSVDVRMSFASAEMKDLKKALQEI